jgi:hypothetical protein
MQAGFREDAIKAIVRHQCLTPKHLLLIFPSVEAAQVFMDGKARRLTQLTRQRGKAKPALAGYHHPAPSPAELAVIQQLAQQEAELQQQVQELTLQMQTVMKQHHQPPQGPQEDEQTQQQQQGSHPATPSIVADMEGVESVGGTDEVDMPQRSDNGAEGAGGNEAAHGPATDAEKGEVETAGEVEGGQAGALVPYPEQQLGNEVGPPVPAHQQAHPTDAQPLPSRLQRQPGADRALRSPPQKLRKSTTLAIESSARPTARPTPREEAPLLCLEGPPCPPLGNKRDRAEPDPPLPLLTWPSISLEDPFSGAESPGAEL